MNRATSGFPQFMQLPDHLIVKVMDDCESVCLLNMSETCTQIHQLMIASHKLMKRLKLVVKFTRSTNDTVDKISTILSNASVGRKYTRLKLVYANEALNCYAKPLLLKILKIVGKSVKELDISCGMFSIQDLTLLLKCFDNVEKINLINVQESLNSNSSNSEAQGLLTNLKKLQMQDVKSSFLSVFEHITTLTYFKFHASSREPENFAYGVERFEDFLMRQQNLKSIDIARMHKNCLFRENRIKLITFQLDSIVANRFFVHKSNAKHFFKHLTSLKTIKIYDFYDSRIFPYRADYSNVLKCIFSAPSLQSLGVFNNSINLDDFEICDVRNNSVTHLEYDMWNSKAIEKLIEIFPRLESISFRCFTVRLRDVEHEKLMIMTTSGGYQLEEFSYQPRHTITDHENFEKLLICFISRHKTMY